MRSAFCDSIGCWRIGIGAEFGAHEWNWGVLQMLLRLARHWERWRDEPSSMAMIPSPFGSVAVRHDSPLATAKRSRKLELCAGARALLADSRPGTMLLGRCTSAFHPLPALIPNIGRDPPLPEHRAEVLDTRSSGSCRGRVVANACLGWSYG